MIILSGHHTLLTYEGGEPTHNTPSPPTEYIPPIDSQAVSSPPSSLKLFCTLKTFPHI